MLPPAQQKTKSLNVIFILGKAQTLIAPTIIKKTGHPTYVFTSHKINKKHGVTHINLKPSLLSAPIQALRYVRFLFAAAAAKNINLYTPHLLNFITNKLYYKNTEKITLNFLFDGILNYRNAPAHSDNLKSYQERQRIKSFFILHKYVTNKTEIIERNLQPKSKLIIPSFAQKKHIKFLGDIVTIETQNHNNKKPLPKTALVLIPGGNTNLLKFRKKTVETIIENQINKIYYKNHPSENTTEIDFIEALTEKKIAVEKIESSIPAEEFFQSHPCEYVISGLSSALISLKAIESSTKALCLIESDTLNQDPSLQDVANLMGDIGIEIIHTD